MCRAKSNRVWCAECFWRARRSRFEFLREGAEDKRWRDYMAAGGSWRRRRVRQKNLVRMTWSEALQEEDRFVYDEMNTGSWRRRTWSGWPDQKHSRRRIDLSMMRWIRVIRCRRVQGIWSGWPGSEVQWNTPGGVGDIRIARARLERPGVAKEEDGRAQFVNRYEEWFWTRWLRTVCSDWARDGARFSTETW